MVDFVIPYAPRNVFKEFHNRIVRWACIVAHRRCGKTVACINDLIRRALVDAKEDGRYAYLAPFHSQAKSIAWDYLLKYSAPIRTNQNATDLWVELINGARVRLFGADNPDALRGLYLDGVILDEYADMKPRVWGEIIRPLLADRAGWAVFIGTPKGHNAFHAIHDEARTSENWYALTLRASETGILAQAELADAQRSMTVDQYEQEFECSFEAAILGAYYGKEMALADKQGRITTVEYDRARPVYTAWDLGFRDDTAIWWYQIIRDEVHVIDFHASSGKDVPFYAGLVSGKPYRYERHFLPHDARAKTLASGGKSIIEQMAAHLGIETMAIVPELSVQDGIQAARMMLAKTWFDSSTNDGLEALRQYQREFDEEKKVFKEKPRHDWTSHPADAFRMMAIAWRAEAKSPPPPEPPRGVSVGNNTATLEELWATMPKNKPKRI